MTKRFSPQVESRLREAGWYPGRQIDEEELQRMESRRPLFPAAQTAIREFSGIYVSEQGEVVMRNGRLDTSNYRDSFCIDPLALMDSDDMEVFDDYARRLNRGVYPLGLRSLRYPGDLGKISSTTIKGSGAMFTDKDGRVRGDGAMFIDEDGCVFSYRYTDIRVGRTIDGALNNLLKAKGKKTGKGNAKSKSKAIEKGEGMQYWDVDSDSPDTFPPLRR